MSGQKQKMFKQSPISLMGGQKSEVRTQFAALCYRIKKGKLRVLLITSREAGRWIVPKGWPMDGKTPAECAEIEAWEEAGVKGRSDGRCVGIFSYAKDKGQEGELPVIAMIFPIKVDGVADTYPEASQRDRVWVSRKKAAKMVEETELARILRDFDPEEAT